MLDIHCFSCIFMTLLFFEVLVVLVVEEIDGSFNLMLLGRLEEKQRKEGWRGFNSNPLFEFETENY